MTSQGFDPRYHRGQIASSWRSDAQVPVSYTIDNRPKQPLSMTWQDLNAQGEAIQDGLYGQANNPTEMLAKQYRNRDQSSFMDRLTGDVNVGDLDEDRLLKDRRFHDLYEKNPDAAEKLFTDTHGYSLAEAVAARDFRTPAQQINVPLGVNGGMLPFSTPQGELSARDLRLMAARRATMAKKTPADKLKEFESFTGVNPIYAMSDYKWSKENNMDRGVTTGTPSGYDAATGEVVEPGGNVFNSQSKQWENRPARKVRVDPSIVANLRNAYRQWGGDYTGGQYRTPITAPQATRAAAPVDAHAADMAELRALEQKRQTEMAARNSAAATSRSSLPGLSGYVNPAQETTPYLEQMARPQGSAGYGSPSGYPQAYLMQMARDEAERQRIERSRGMEFGMF